LRQWIGRDFADWQAVKAAVNEQWSEGLDIFQEMLFELSKIELPTIRCRKRRLRWDTDNGDEVDNDRLRAGQEYWRLSRREETRGFQTICIVTNISTSGGVSSGRVLWRGALAVVLADLLEKQGHRVELWAADRGLNAYENRYGSFQAVCLKQADEPLDLVSVVNAVSGWFYRTIFFQDLKSETGSNVACGYGAPTKIDPQDEAVRNLIGAATPLIVDSVWSKSDCITKARQLVAGLVS